MNPDNTLTTIQSSTNKDILIVSLLEYICDQQKLCEPTLLKNIISYLQSNGIIDKIKLNTPEYITIKNDFKNVINELIKNNCVNSSLETNIVPINESRYENDFIEVEKISKGGFGVVYKTINKLDKVMYAIKKIPLKYTNFENNNKVLNEAIILANINHENIIRYYSTWIELNNDDLIQKEVYSDSYSNTNSNSNSNSNSNKNKNIIMYNKNNSDDSFSWDYDSIDTITLHNQTNIYNTIICIQMELCTMTLKDYILKINLTDTITYNIIKDILKAIDYIHSKNIIHCDLSLKNILVNGDGIIKICDFGLAEYIGENDHILKEKTYGTLIYCAPESIKYSKYSYKTDVYTLGIIFYELLNNFTTEMERLISIQKFKNKKVKCKYDHILYNMINEDENMRPCIVDILFM